MVRHWWLVASSWSSARVQSHYWIWNDSNTNDFAGDLLERPASEAIFSHREERVGKSSLKLPGRYALQ